MSWIEIVGVVSGALAVLMTYLTFFEKKRSKRLEKENLKRERRERIYRDKLLEDISAVVREDIDAKLSNYITKEEYDELETTVRESEISRLSSEIIHYAEDLRNKVPKSSVTYCHIHEVYERYRKLGGNSYIKSEFEYIKKTMKDRGF